MKEGAPKHISKGQQKELLRSQKEKAKKRNRLAAKIGGTTAGLLALGGVVAGGIYASQNQEPAPNIPALEQYEPASPVLTEQFIRDTLTQSVSEINTEFDTQIDNNFVQRKTVIVPRSETMTPKQIEEWCSLFPCREALGAVTSFSGEPTMYINTSLLEFLQTTENASPQQVKEITKSISFNELYHLVTDTYPIPPTDEFKNLFINYVKQELNTNTGEDVLIQGGKISVSLPDRPGGERAFSMGNLHEYYSTYFMEYMMKKTGQEDFFGKGMEEKNNRFGSKPKLFSELLAEMGEKEVMEKTLFSYQLSGRGEDWIRFVGSKFTKDPEAQLQKGFDILEAIDNEDLQRFYELIENN